MISSIRKSFYILFLRILLKFGMDEGNKSIILLIKSDLYRCIGSREINKLYKYILSDPGFEFIFFLRFASIRPVSPFRKRIHAFSYYFHKKYFFKYGYQIPLNTVIGEGFQILHFGHIVFNPSTKVGDNCTIFPGVTIGQDKKGLTPTIGNEVWIGTNAILVGGINIGNNVLIAPGSFVNFDVPDNCLVIGNPGKFIVKTKKIVDGYLNNRI